MSAGPPPTPTPDLVVLRSRAGAARVTEAAA